MKGMVIQDMKKMFYRIGALALAFMLALSLAATPALAANEVGRSTITINKAIPGVTYNAYQLLRLVDYDKDLTAKDKDNKAIIGWYKYEIPAATDPDSTIWPLLVKLIDVDDAGKPGDFKVGRDVNGNVTKAGFEVKGDDVMFWVPATTTTAGEDSSATATTDDAETSRGKWDAASQEAYMTRFANELRKLVDAELEKETVTLRPTAGPIKATGSKTVTFTDLEQGYWFVTSSAGTRSMVFTNPNKDNTAATIDEKNQAPSLTKKVRDEDSGKYVDENDAGIGDIVEYRVKIDAPVGTENLTLVDTLTEGLTFVKLKAVSFQPRGDRMAFPISEVAYDKDKNIVLSNDITLLDTNDKGETITIDLTSDEVQNKGVDVGNNLKVTVCDSDLTDGSKVTQQLKIEFDKMFLKSLRSNETNPDTYDQPPMENDDKRLPKATDEPAPKPEALVAAHYNVFLGDMNTQTDDGGTIVVEYTARVNENAALTKDPQTNTAQLKYGHNSDGLHGADDPDSETPESKTTTHVYDLNLYKFAAGDKTKGLSGAQFSIGRKLLSIVGADFDAKQDGTAYGTYQTGDPNAVRVTAADVDYTNLAAGRIDNTLVHMVEITSMLFDEKGEPTKDWVAKGDRVYRVAKYDETTGYEAGSTTTIESGVSGKIIVKGLDSNMYVVYEDKAPSGYSALDKPVFVTIGSQAATVTRTEGEGEGAKPVTESAGIGGKLFIEDTGKAADNGATRVFTQAATGENDSGIEDGVLQIANNSGMVMPTTGGIGTTIFYVVGIALVLGAGVLLVVKKRVGSNEE